MRLRPVPPGYTCTNDIPLFGVVKCGDTLPDPEHAALLLPVGVNQVEGTGGVVAG